VQRTVASFCFLVLLIGLDACNSTLTSTQTPGSADTISISPVNTAEGSADLALTITASSTAKPQGPINWRAVWSLSGSESPLLTFTLSNTQLLAVVPMGLLNNAAIAQVRIELFDHIEQTVSKRSASVPFTVTTPVPGAVLLTAISPATATPGSSDVTLTVTGLNFVHQKFTRSRVVWSANNTDTVLATNFVSNTELSAVIPAALLSNPGPAIVAVETGDIMADGPLPRSNPTVFTVFLP
jgi:hypothetical protein